MTCTLSIPSDKKVPVVGFVGQVLPAKDLIGILVQGHNESGKGKAPDDSGASSRLVLATIEESKVAEVLSVLVLVLEQEQQIVSASNIAGTVQLFNV